MAKNKGQTESFITYWTEGQKYVIDDIEHQSKALVPIQIDVGNSVEIVQVDGGLITGLSKGEAICDNLVYTIRDNSMGLNITWIIELKGTKNPKEAKHSIKQIISSIQYFQDQVTYPKAFKYVNNRDYVFAARNYLALPAISVWQVLKVWLKFFPPFLIYGIFKNI